MLAARHHPYLLLSQEVRERYLIKATPRQLQHYYYWRSRTILVERKYDRQAFLFYRETPMSKERQTLSTVIFFVIYILQHESDRYPGLCFNSAPHSPYIGIGGICVTTDPWHCNVLLPSHFSYNYYDVTSILIPLWYVVQTY